MNQIEKAVESLRNGGVIIFPTDTVWGIGAWVGSSDGIKKLYRIKNRPDNKPTAVLVKDLHQAKQYGIFSPTASSLAHKHWPGALTLIVAATPAVPEEIIGNQGTVGLRVPDFEPIQSLCHLLGGGIVAGSANFSGFPAPKTRGDIDQKLISAVDFLLEGESLGQPASTVFNSLTQKMLRIGPVEIGEGSI